MSGGDPTEKWPPLSNAEILSALVAAGGDPNTAARNLQEITGPPTRQIPHVRMGDTVRYGYLAEIGDEDMSSLLSDLRQGGNITKLVFTNAFKEGTNLSPIFNMLTENHSTSLMELDINIAQLNIDDLSALGYFLRRAPKLSALYVRNTGIGRNIIHLLQGIKDNSSLTYLNLTENGIGDDEVGMIMEAVNKSNIEVLFLGDNDITDTGADRILELLQLNKNLRSIDVSDSNMSREKEDAIHEAVTVQRDLPLGAMTKSARKKAW